MSNQQTGEIPQRPVACECDGNQLCWPCENAGFSRPNPRFKDK